jgi:hypothetical protein
MDEELRELERRSRAGDLDAAARLQRSRERAGTMLAEPPSEVWVGIDPGKKGYVVALCPGGTLQSWSAPVDAEEDYDLGRAVDIVRALAALKPRKVMLERQQPAYRAPGQDKGFNNLVRASFMVGYGFALWETALVMAGLDYDLVMPSVWKKAMGLTASKEVTERAERAKAVKGNSIALATSLWPNHDFRRTTRCKPSPDQAEAALLAEYGRRKHGG